MIGPTWLCPDSIVPMYDCVQTWLCPQAIVAIHNCAHTWLCPGISVPQLELWLDTIMPMDIYNCVFYKIMVKLYWCEHYYTIVLLPKQSEMWLFKCCSVITSSIPSEIFRNFIFPISNMEADYGQSCYYYIYGHSHVCAHCTIVRAQ